MTATVYTDASHSDELRIAACGFCIVYNGKLIKHQVQLYENMPTSTHAEVMAITEGIQAAYLLKDVKRIAVKTDCKTIADVYDRKSFKKKWLHELKETVTLCAEGDILLTVQHIKGHNGDRYNTLVDVHCRKNLRKVLFAKKNLVNKK